MYETNFPTKRFAITLDFVKKHLSQSEKILDLGVPNPFSELLIKEGFSVANTKGEDLDIHTSVVKTADYDAVTAFQIFEHMLAPFNVLQDIQAPKLIASVPLRLWFSTAYRSKTDMWDRHYHEFEDWQFDWLLEKTGWNILERKKFTGNVNGIGFRPLLRKFTPRFYLIYAERKT